MAAGERGVAGLGLRAGRGGHELLTSNGHVNATTRMALGAVPQ